MRMLFILPARPGPPWRGYTRLAFELISRLAEWHRVDILSFDDRSRQPPEELTNRCGRFELVPFSRVQAWARGMLAIGSDIPFQVAMYRSLDMERRIREFSQSCDYDVIIYQLTRMASYAAIEGRAASVLHMVDPFVLNYRKSMKWRSPFVRPIYSLEASRLRRYEGRVWGWFEDVLLICRRDAEEYASVVPGSLPGWVPYAVDSSHFAPDAAVVREPCRIIITGNLFYGPNVDGIDYFCRSVYPTLKRLVPPVRLTLAGASPAWRVRRWSRSDKSIELVASVPDIRPYLNRAVVSVCPVRLAVGTQTKVLEAMAMGTPVVTTSAGNHGVEGGDGRELVVADDPTEMAERIAELLRGKCWNDLSERGRAFVQERFNWDASARQFEAVLLGAAADSAKG
jgi:polysaccharide biosynthesis protein PslH